MNDWINQIYREGDALHAFLHVCLGRFWSALILILIIDPESILVTVSPNQTSFEHLILKVGRGLDGIYLELDWVVLDHLTVITCFVYA